MASSSLKNSILHRITNSRDMSSLNSVDDKEQSEGHSVAIYANSVTADDNTSRTDIRVGKGAKTTTVD